MYVNLTSDMPSIVDNVSYMSILFYLHYFSNNVNKDNHIIEQKNTIDGNIIHYCISHQIQYKLNASNMLQGRMCHLHQCNFDYLNICNNDHVFLKFILWECQLLGLFRCSNFNSCICTYNYVEFYYFNLISNYLFL